MMMMMMMIIIIIIINNIIIITLGLYRTINTNQKHLNHTKSLKNGRVWAR